MGKFTISKAIFNSKLLNYQRVDAAMHLRKSWDRKLWALRPASQQECVTWTTTLTLPLSFVIGRGFASAPTPIAAAVIRVRRCGGQLAYSISVDVKC